VNEPPGSYISSRVFPLFQDYLGGAGGFGGFLPMKYFNKGVSMTCMGSKRVLLINLVRGLVLASVALGTEGPASSNNYGYGMAALLSSYRS
jgi:hypothetical protein